MKQLLILLSFLFTFVGANAQTAQTPEQQQAHTQAMRMQKNINLTETQTTQVEAVFLARIIAINAIENDATKTPEQKKADKDAVTVAKENELATILTADQMTQYRQIRQARKDRAQANSGN